ncbi:hypothetical protein P5673_029666 [Acropora cervicornis]|uniref:DUF7869 domain-containing protein n=1 Tax=Acropora cervicornis TaxID=6130 RepID=A0AAD9UTW8_ACRCE|nr:hypothetical protein P5673_029666 [Acropora cervicornis]
MADVEFEREESENQLIEKALKFLHSGCGCSRGAKGGPCSKQFEEETVLHNLHNSIELTNAELDLVVLTSIQAFTRKEDIGSRRSRITQNVHSFLTNYVEENAIVLPGRIPGFKRDDVKVLSSSDTRASDWRAYSAACEASGEQAVCYSKFVDLWLQFHPDVVGAKPMTDLCLTCQQNTTKLLRAANLPETEKSDCIKAQQDHLNCAQAEREFYRETCSSSATMFNRLEVEINLNEVREPCSLNGMMHYSFDYAQQVHFPSNPMQPGPIYFKTPRKCGIFGVMCEAVPRQVNYLIDKAATVGKGANATISYVHHFFAQHGLGETEVHLHADNCAGQNKNNFFLWYFAWRIACKLHHSIKYSFLIAGHTKFGPDRRFGLLKKSYKVNFISSIYELARMVDASSNAGVNKAQLVATHDDRILVPVYDWSSFLGQYFKKIPHIKKFHHFRFSKNEPGIVYCKELLSSPEQAFQLLKDDAVIPPNPVLPQTINPEGLSEECRNYLFREIRQFCRSGTEDLVAPAP